MNTSDFRILVSTYSGLEEVLKMELLRLGARDLKILPSAVSCVGDMGFVYKANFCLRTALKILIQVKSFQIESSDDLFKKVVETNFSVYLDSVSTFSVRCNVDSEYFKGNQEAELLLKEAVAESWNNSSGIIPVPVLNNPEMEVYLEVHGNKCTLWLNSSGNELSDRGYAAVVGKDSINAVMSAGMIFLSGWEPQKPLVNFHCTRGILPVEASLNAAKIPPGVFREKYAFEKWKNFDAVLFNLIRDKQLAHISENDITVYAHAPDEKSKTLILEDCIRAGVEDMISVSAGELDNFQRPELNGTIIIQMVSDEISESDHENIFSEIGDYLKSNYSGYKAWIFTLPGDIVKSIGLIPNEKLQLFLGNNEFWFYGYDLFKKKEKTGLKNDFAS